MLCDNTPYTLSSFNTRCKEGNLPSITEILIANYDDVSAVTFDTTAQTATVTPVTGKKFIQCKLGKYKGSFESVAEESEDAPLWTHTLSLNVSRQDKEKRYKLMSLYMLPTIIIVKDSNGEYRLMGDEDRDNYVEGKTYTSTTGQADGDSNHYELTFSIKTAQDAYFIDPATIPGLIN